MKQKQSGAKFRITIAVFAALILGILFAAVTDGGTSPVTAVVAKIMSPVQYCATQLAEKLTDMKLYFASSQKYIEEIESLEAQIEQYRSDLVDYNKDKIKLDAYEEFLELKQQHKDYKFEPASIIARSTDDIYGSFTINKGSSDGIKINDPVIYGSTLIGTIKQITDDTATVYTLFNPNVNVSVYEIRTRLDCIIESDNALTMQGYLKLTGLSGGTSIVPGGIIATSGIGGKYPSDLIVGTVAEVIQDDTSISTYALITPETDYNELRDVFVLKAFNK